MGTTADKLSYLNETKLALKTSINNFNESAAVVSDEATFREYATAVESNNIATQSAMSNFESKLSDITGEAHSGETPKEIVVNAINSRGGSIATSNTWSECADEIKYMESEWSPDRLWPDIKTILSTDTSRSVNGGIYDGAYIVLSFVIDPSDQVFALNSTTSVAIKTSDGVLYTYAVDGASVTHSWDTNSYTTDSLGMSCRWIIIYQSTNSLDHRSASAYGNNTLNAGGTGVGAQYVLFAVNLSMTLNTYNTRSMFFSSASLQAFDFIESYRVTQFSAGSVHYFCQFCPVYYIPWRCFPSVPVFGYNCFSRCRVGHFPEVQTVAAGSFVETQIHKIDGLTFTSVGYASQNSLIGIKWIGYLDMSSCFVKSGEPLFANLNALQHCLFKLPSFSVNISSATILDFESLVYICNNAPDVTLVSPAPILTLGVILQARVGQDNLDKLIAKGWTIA